MHTFTQFHGAVFKVALFDQWMVIVNGRKLVDDLRKRPDDELSFNEALEEVRTINSYTEYYGKGANILFPPSICTSSIAPVVGPQMIPITSKLSGRSSCALSPQFSPT